MVRCGAGHVFNRGMSPRSTSSREPVHTAVDQGAVQPTTLVQRQHRDFHSAQGPTVAILEWGVHQAQWVLWHGQLRKYEESFGA